MNDTFHLAVAEGCPAEVTKEAIVLAEQQQGETLSEREAEIATTVGAYAYSAGRLARFDALVKGDPKLIDLLHRGVHEFFHDEPFTAHTGTDCSDCLTVATLTADLSAAFYNGGYKAVPLADVAIGEDNEDLDDEDDNPWPDTYELEPIAFPDTVTERLPREDGPDDEEIERLADRAEQGYTADQLTQRLPLVADRALHTSVPGEWRVPGDGEIRHG